MRVLLRLQRTLTVMAAAIVVAACGVYRDSPSRRLDYPTVSSVAERWRPLAQRLSSLTGYAPVTDNDIEIITDNDRRRDVLIEQSHLARESIWMQYYSFEADSLSAPVYDALCRRAGEGLDCRLLVESDNIPSRELARLHDLAPAELQIRGWHDDSSFFDRIVNFNSRNHRKLFCRDAVTAITGGRNIRNEYFDDWRDTDVMITGAAVMDMGRIFAADWRATGPDAEVLRRPSADALRRAREAMSVDAIRGVTVQIVPEDPEDGIMPSEESYILALESARDYFYITDPYFLPTDGILDALLEASRRGVDVRILFPGENDVFLMKWSAEHFYRRLLEAGVRIYEWPHSILHAKTFVSDGYLSCIGSCNLDLRSFTLQNEMNVLIYDERAAGLMRQIFLEDISDSREVLADEVKKWTALRVLRNAVIMPFGGLL